MALRARSARSRSCAWGSSRRWRRRWRDGSGRAGDWPSAPCSSSPSGCSDSGSRVRSLVLLLTFGIGLGWVSRVPIFPLVVRHRDAGPAGAGDGRLCHRPRARRDDRGRGRGAARRGRRASIGGSRSRSSRSPASGRWRSGSVWRHRTRTWTRPRAAPDPVAEPGRVGAGRPVRAAIDALLRRHHVAGGGLRRSRLVRARLGEPGGAVRGDDARRDDASCRSARIGSARGAGSSSPRRS